MYRSHTDRLSVLRLRHVSGGEEGRPVEEDVVLQKTPEREGGADV